MLPVRRQHPDAARAGDPDVAVLVALHAVDVALAGHAGADALGDDAPVVERAVRRYVEDLDVARRRVVDVEELLVGREAEAVRLVELALLDDELELAAVRRHPEDPAEAELVAVALAADPVVPASVVGIGEVDASVKTPGDGVVG